MPFLASVLATAVALSSPSPTPSASPSPTALGEIGRTATVGRKANLVRRAGAASEGTIDQEQIATRPLLRPGEVLEAIPGLVISQHSGEGKANQYYLRGFQLDHGTDLASTVDGVPVNLPTHAHGQGYSDVNWLIPELVSFVRFQKGPYYANHGDFSTAGSYELFYRDALAPAASLGVGAYGYDRLLLADAPRLGNDRLLYALELAHDNGSLDKPDEYRKVNAVLRWSRQRADTHLALTASAYHGTFDASDQIPQRLINAGVLDRGGAVDPSDGGDTDRYALSGELTHDDAHGTTRLSAYGFAYRLDLFSNFTYGLDDATDFFNVTGNPVTCNRVYSPCAAALAGYTGPRTTAYTPYCPANALPAGGATVPGSVAVDPRTQFAFACGDQREQLDARFVSGADASRTFVGRRATTTVGLGLRNDNIATVGLFLTHDRLRYGNGALSDAKVLERDASAYASTELAAGSKLRLTGGLRGDLYAFDVRALDPADSGRAAQGIVSPKFLAAYALDSHGEVYLDAGTSFHSNDARGITQTHDPQTHAAFDSSGAPVAHVDPLVRAHGYELGYRYTDRKLVATLALWRLDLASELVFDGDHGTTSAGGPTRRKGIELTTFFTPGRGLTLDADVATSTAHFLTDDGTGIAVPESLNVVSAAGIALDRPSYAASLRLRYFGPRALDRAGSAVSAPSSLLNAQFTAKLARARRLTLDVFNLTNARSDDVAYFYGSWTQQDARNRVYRDDPAVNPALGGSGVADDHLHPSQKRTVRLTLRPPL
ncbi:MAG: TonB-dependent receptor [Candidatus Eremiobacteraeota bacterium]|nr:TonB-dependent receptor [Candidatus Eremiobacteraeota bacterium]